MNKSFMKHMATAGITAGLASISFVANASIINCGGYVLNTGTATSYMCQSFNSVGGSNGPMTSTGGPVTTVINQTGASTITTYGGTAVTALGSNASTWGGNAAGGFSGEVLNATTTYLVLVTDVPPLNSPWMVISATGADLLSAISVTEPVVDGTFKYRIYNAPASNPVPLPGTLALFGLGLAALGLRKKVVA
jgi:PEP-CTERM motif